MVMFVTMMILAIFGSGHKMSNAATQEDDLSTFFLRK